MIFIVLVINDILVLKFVFLIPRKNKEQVNKYALG